MAKTQGSVSGYRFIRDDPASENHFDAHERIASAMSATIDANPDLHTIGLIGPWGSGKSTVLRLLSEKLTAQYLVDSPSVFIFDAWLHHGEPVRRAFLEDFYRFTTKKLAAEATEVVKSKVDEVTGRSTTTQTYEEPRISWGGLVVLLSIAVGAYGITQGHHLRRVPGVNALLGHFPDWAPVLLPVGLPLFTATVVAIVRLIMRKCRHSNNDATQPESLRGLLLNRQHQSRRTRVSGSPTPTAIEFAETFRSILATCAPSRRRVIVVVDNLDRLAQSEAKEAWAMLRTFFQPLNGSNYDRQHVPVVIVPVAEETVDSLYGSKEVGQSFMEKTFDITFYLPRPALADWQNYLTLRMKDVFGEELKAHDDWIEQVTQLADARFQGTSNAEELVTPRSINTLVNQIASYWLQYRDTEISFASIAYYCLNKSKLDTGLLLATSELQAAVDIFDREWRQAVAALHYGVPFKDALAVLLTGRLEQSIAGRDEKEFAKICKIRGADLILRRILSRYRTSSGISRQTILNSVHLLAKAEGSHGVIIREAWMMLADALANTNIGWDPLVTQDAQDLVTLVDRESARERDVLTSILARVNTIANVQESSAEAQAYWWRHVAVNYPRELTKLGRFFISGTGQTVVSTACLLDDLPIALEHLTCRQPDDVLKALTTDIESGADKAQDLVRRLRAVQLSAIPISWVKYIEASFHKINNIDPNRGTSSEALTRAVPCMLAVATYKASESDKKEHDLEEQIRNMLKPKIDAIVKAALGFKVYPLAGYALAAGVLVLKRNQLPSAQHNPESDEAWSELVGAFVTALELGGMDFAHGLPNLEYLTGSPSMRFRHAEFLSIARNLIDQKLANSANTPATQTIAFEP